MHVLAVLGSLVVVQTVATVLPLPGLLPLHWTVRMLQLRLPAGAPVFILLCTQTRDPEMRPEAEPDQLAKGCRNSCQESSSVSLAAAAVSALRSSCCTARCH